MKIGIITFHCANNYGAVLQAFALQKVVSEIQPESQVNIIDYRPKSIVDTYSLFYPVKISASLVLKVRRFFGVILQLPFTLKCKVAFSKFRKKYFTLIHTTKLADFNAIICGSDQIWNPVLTDGLDPRYFGEFKNFTGKLISYSVSDGGELVGVDNLILRDLFSGFSSVSVRESSMISFLQPFFEKPLSAVLDPVFLPGPVFWANIAMESEKTGYIILYQITNNPVLLQEAISIAAQQNKRLIEVSYGVPFISIVKNTRTLRVAISPPEFLGLFKNADLVLTNSFHGTAFSIIFQKQFFSYILEKRSSRMADLLNNLGLSDRYVSSCLDHVYETINYTQVKKQLDHEITKSMKFLKKALHGES